MGDDPVHVQVTVEKASAIAQSALALHPDAFDEHEKENDCTQGNPTRTKARTQKERGPFRAQLVRGGRDATVSAKLLTLFLLVTGSGLSACNDDGDDSMTDAAVTTSTETLCAKYGGPSAVDQVVHTNVIGAIAEDCRINAFFTTLSEAAFTRFNDCLSLQVQELFGCGGVSYKGAQDSNGLPCRSMSDAHRELGIASADFNALIEDVVAGLSEAGVEDADIQAPRATPMPAR